VWVPAGQTVSIGGFSISRGLIYVGRQLPGAASGKPDPALVDPSLAIDRQAPDYAGANMGYWPSYSDIAPGCRAAYLRWLADGRHAADAYIGYVFLYFYGLERRLLVDAEQSAAAQGEREALVAEVQRLLGIYGANHSFRGYAENLLAVTMPADVERRYLSPPPTGREDWVLPFELQLGLGQLAADGRPLPVTWALAWLRLHPEVWLRMAATRCPDEFGEVFARRYRDRYGDGLLLKPGSAVLGGTYRPASDAIPVWHLPAGPRIPDVAGLGPPLAKLRELADEACTDLDAYSRYLGRHPDAAGTAAALALLPAGIERPADAATQALIAWAQDSLGASERAEVVAAELLARWSAAMAGSRPGKSDAVLLARLLERHGLGVEPDVRFGGPVPAGPAPVVLFRRAAEIVSVSGDGYAAAATLTQLAAAVASADGQVAAAEQDLLERRVVLAFGLAEDERRRLRAHLMRTLAHPPTPAALKKRATMLTEGQRREAGELLVALAASDGNIAPAEIDLLTRLFDALGLDRSDVSGHVHALGGDTLTRLRTVGVPAPGYAIPRSAPPEAGRRTAAVVLDPLLIEARLAESARAASYLAEIFTDDETEAAASPAPGTPNAGIGDGVAGLDAPHTALLRRLADQPRWMRGDFDNIAIELGLLPDGALETLNEAAFEAAGEPVCEGTDPIEINSYAFKEMLR
jgi:uncharacterized tellurite resistance protein B-like protein